ncbi:MAG: glycosyl hydrolase [Phycisphaerae bacterium]
MKRLIYWLSCLLAISCANTLFAWVEWNYTGGSHSWNNVANWGGAVPIASGDPIIRGQGAGNEALIDSGVAAVGNLMWVGFSGQADLDIAGGSLTLNAFRVGVDNGPGNVNLSSGAVTINGDTVVGDSGSGVGTLTMSGGTFTVSNPSWLYIGYNGATGTVNLDGGTLTTYRVVMGSGNPHLNITGGKLVIANTDAAGVANEINSYILAGQLAFYNGDPLATHTLTINGSGFTEVTASPPSGIYAFDPAPANLTTEVALNSNLSWSGGAGAVSHDVYFGNYSPGSFRGNQTAVTYNPGELLPNRTYYWRINEKSGAGITTTGNVWQFTTVSLPWSDNFNSISFTAGGWIVAGSGVTLSSNAGYPSGYGARLKGSSGTNYIRKNKSTEGYNAITIQYDRRVSSSISVTLTVDFSADGGANWTTLETVSGSAGTVWANKNWNLGVTADNNPNLCIRFRTTAGSTNYAYIDNVQITGTELTSVTVPTVAGMTQAEAQTAISNAGLTIGVVTQLYSDTIAAGVVISQNPAAGTGVSLDSAVDLVVSLGPPISGEALYQGFVNPPSEVGPDVYWFWNANALSETEISRELDVLKDAGIQGVLIFPLMEPMGAAKIDEQPLQWLSPEWVSMLKFTTEAAQQRGMYVDVLVGTGWPFGGPSVQPGDGIKIIKLGTTELTGPGTFNGNIHDLMVLPPGAYGETTHGLTPELKFLRLVPKNPQNFDAGTELKNLVQPDGSITFTIPSGQYVLYTGTYREGFIIVNIAAPGGEGTVIDHLSRTALENYLVNFENALKPIMGNQIGLNMRTLHCDSFEVTNANWTSDFAQEFQNRRGYSIEPYLPFIIEWPPASGGYGFNDTVNRVQYDFWKTQQELFNERFLVPFYQWTHNQGTQCRTEGYGCYEIDQLQNKLIADQPMGETWIALNRDIPTSELLIPVDKQASPTDVGIWSCKANKYESSAAHLTGRRQVSCETMTSGSSAFRLRLQDIKIGLDIDFVSGINHTYFHGFNWSPPKAGFPGWFYCGSYIDDKELWWPYFNEINKYNSRLSWVLQNSVSQSQVALMSWESFLWEALAQNGYCVDYVNEKIIRDADYTGGKLNYGSQSYDIIILNRIDAIEPETATALQNFVAAGGKIIFVDYPPVTAPGLADAVNRSNFVTSTIAAMRQQYPDRIIVVAGTDSDGWFNWVPATLAQTGISPMVQISPPDRLFYQIHQSVDGKDIFFFANLDVNNAKTFTANFNIAGKTPWKWDAMTGSRSVMPHNGSTLNITLQPTESLLIVFEPELGGVPETEPVVHYDDYLEINSQWDLTLNRVSEYGPLSSVSYNIYFGTNYNAVDTASRLPFDFDGDGIVQWSDLAELAGQWLKSNTVFDLNGDGSVDFADFAEFAGQFNTEAVPEFYCNQAEPTFNPTGLNPNTTYYWRVDEVTDSATFKGPVWNFATEP